MLMLKKWRRSQNTLERDGKWKVKSERWETRRDLPKENKPRNVQTGKGTIQDRQVRQKWEEPRTFTPLNTPCAKLLMEIQDMKELEWPRPMVMLPARETKADIVISQGSQARYGRVPAAEGGDRAGGLPPPRAGVINVIAGGGDSNSARKKYTRSLGICSIQRKARFSQNNTFGEEDLVSVAHPHDDALVIVGDIADFDVKRVVVDGRSTANVLTWDAFLGLKIPPNKLKTVITFLQSFGGATVIREGTVELPVTLETYPTAVVIVASFLVVKTPMAHNAIYGRLLLNATEAIPSTYHQVMKFPTSRGVGCVRGDQQASRK
ncbi:uncharacterized protein LOC111400116 [Olea europaea var. sylvestris]|uniref:uncharacterized protein LOC111400116 n=1 Tax=Olea europaea var. sylvestris TaxID=158386 RepID=UPI000C1CD72E|nr:uncharacterized protein LOC111400116 [Olea europaea var. sylvestris]